MKRLNIWFGTFLVATAAAAVAPAAVRDDYAMQWPLVLSDASAGAYRIELDANTYRAAHAHDLRDLDVFNGQGQPVPAALFAPKAQAAQRPTLRELPWFQLPQGNAGRAADIAVISERDTDGRVRRVETRMADAPAAPVRPPDAWLVDASALREPITALELEWAPSDALDVGYRVEGSDDLREWRVLQPGVQLVDLVRDGRRLQQRRLPLQGHARYLRLSPLREGTMLPLLRVRAEVAAPAPAVDWNWEELRGKAAVENGIEGFEFELDGRFPVALADVSMIGNAASEWTLYSRDDNGKDAQWIRRVGPWIGFQLGAGDRSAAQALDVAVRDRHWRLVPRSPVVGVPTLRLGYRPEAVVFVAQGDPPYALVAGSARAARGDAPLSQLIDTIRAQRSPGWQPAAATLGAPVVLAGEQAYAPAPPQRDWKTWLLWAALILGAAIVSWFALSLLRKPRT